jgi:hypothetical protein
MEPNVKYCCSEFRSDRRSNSIFITCDIENSEERYAYGPNIMIKFCPHCGKMLPEEPF